MELEYLKIIFNGQETIKSKFANQRETNYLDAVYSNNI
jgi:hypothetical protein